MFSKHLRPTFVTGALFLAGVLQCSATVTVNISSPAANSWNSQEIEINASVEDDGEAINRVDFYVNVDGNDDINHANMKLFCTNCGINVGEDGMTHQCIDYFGLLNSTYGWKVITPADPNQTDRVVRHVLSHPGEEFICVLEGEILFTVGDTEFRMRPGDTLFFNSLDPHGVVPATRVAKYVDVFI